MHICMRNGTLYLYAELSRMYQQTILIANEMCEEFAQCWLTVRVYRRLWISLSFLFLTFFFPVFDYIIKTMAFRCAESRKNGVSSIWRMRIVCECAFTKWKEFYQSYKAVEANEWIDKMKRWWISQRHNRWWNTFELRLQMQMS